MSERLIRQWAAGFSNLHTGFAFDPNAGTVVVEPTAQGKGYWVGAPSVTQDPRDGAIYLVYRVRRPRGVEPDRGAEIHIVRSLDGKSFEHVWTGYKDALNTTSIERCALVPQDDGTWVLYPSYVDPADGRWRTDRLTAATPSEFDFADVEPVLTAADTATEGVKDPFVFQVAGLWHMIVSYATQEGNASAESMHGTNDAYNTGLIKSRTGLATSEDGRHWIWEGKSSAHQPTDGIATAPGSEQSGERTESGWGCTTALPPSKRTTRNGSASRTATTFATGIV
ncbi:MAG: hypothetical protein R3C02_22075 [Planctomycetaceae bacterium]